MIPFIAWRYLFSTRQRFVPLLAGVTLAGCTLGFFFLTLVLGILRGFQEELQSRWIGLNAHLTVTGLQWEEASSKKWIGKISAWPEIKSVRHFIEGEVIIKTHEKENPVSVAAKLKGFDSLDEDFLKKVSLYPPDPEDWTLLGGDELLAALGIHPDFEEEVSLLYPFGEIGPTGDWVPRTSEAKVSHRFHSGLYLWDAYTAILPLAEARHLLARNGNEGLQIRLHNFSMLKKIEKRLGVGAPPGVKIESFAQQNQRLFAALKLERIGMTVLLILFLLIASFSMAGLLSMFLSAKRKDLAVLRALGLAPAQARQIYRALGLWLGGLGTILGLVLGMGVLFYLQKNPIQLPPTYYLDTLPVRGGPAQFVLIAGLGFFLAWAASWHPARRAAKMEILPLLREE